MRMQLRICKECGNARILAHDNENIKLHCGICKDNTEHYFTDCILRLVSLKEFQKAIDKS